MSDDEKLIAAGVRNLHEFGYPDCDAKNILTDEIYRRFFASMLRENLGHSSRMDATINAVLARISHD